MNKEHLKELVKQYFNLVEHPVTEEKFGEMYDENKAFKFIFPGDAPKVGDEVKVVTTEGQETLAPDGYHKLEDGTMIKTEGSSIVEITSPEEEAKEDLSEEVFGADEAISAVEGTTPQNEATVTDVPVSELEGPVDTVEEVFKKVMMEMEENGSIASVINQAIADAISPVKEEMKKMKEKMEEVAAAPASEKTMAGKATKMKSEVFSTATNDKVISAIREQLKNKK